LLGNFGVGVARDGDFGSVERVSFGGRFVAMVYERRELRRSVRGIAGEDVREKGNARD
jgi:hypothetical protein